MNNKPNPSDRSQTIRSHLIPPPGRTARPMFAARFVAWRWVAALAAGWMLLAAGAAPALAIRVKDVAFLRGARDNQLIGYGLVVGLDGTGDTSDSLLARKPLANALERMALSLSPKDIKGRSIAAVLVTATLPPFAKAGSKVDVTVDTLGDSVSLRGGTLMLTLLHGANQVVYSTAQGPITGIPNGIARPPDGGESPDTSELMDNRSSMLATKGFVIGGALVEREINMNLNSRARVFVNLKASDFTTAFRLAKLINRELGDGSARAKDAGTVEVSVPDSYLGKTVELMAKVENLEITPDSVAKVVLDERTGTIVMGQNVRISPIAISYGKMTIEVKDKPEGEEPPPQDNAMALAAMDGQAIILFKGEVDLKEVVGGLNKIGASTHDLVQVLKSIKTAGALHADLEIR
ncbi:MAG: flagellar basal body P-ring protein FlgI [Deltaproteobacteria bacterium]|nr:flagellar basal body P-ring protein FlgI [Deltaproteobacteria bacterium]